MSLFFIQDQRAQKAHVSTQTANRNAHRIWVMSPADHNILALFVCMHPGVWSQNTRAEMGNPGPSWVFASLIPTQMFGGTQETGHCANTEPRLRLCLSSNISNWFEAMNFLPIIIMTALGDIVDSLLCF